METSAKNATNVEKAFMVMSTQIKSRMKTQPVADGKNGKGPAAVKLNGKAVAPAKGGCC